MSLLNLFVQGDRAYLVVDSGHFNDDGEVTRFGQKFTALPDLRVVIASTGTLQCRHLSAGIRAHEHLSQQQFLEELPNIAREAVERYQIRRNSGVVFAAYSHVKECAFGGIFATHEEPGVIPYRIFQKTAVLLPPLPSVSLNSLCHPSTFDPYRSAKMLADQQRLANFGYDPDKPYCGVAGDLEVVEVSREGIFAETVHTYPAEIGERVTIRHGQALGAVKCPAAAPKCAEE